MALAQMFGLRNQTAVVLVDAKEWMLEERTERALRAFMLEIHAERHVREQVREHLNVHADVYSHAVRCVMLLPC